MLFQTEPPQFGERSAPTEGARLLRLPPALTVGPPRCGKHGAAPFETAAVSPGAIPAGAAAADSPGQHAGTLAQLDEPPSRRTGTPGGMAEGLGRRNCSARRRR